MTDKDQEDGIVVRGKVKRPLPSIIFYIKQEPSLKLSSTDPTNWEQQLDNLLSKTGSRMHILLKNAQEVFCTKVNAPPSPPPARRMSSMASVCKRYGCSLDYLHYLFHSLIKSPFTYGISVLGTVTFEKYLSRIDKFHKRACSLIWLP